MRRLAILVALFALAGLLSLAGCKSKEEAKTPAPTPPAAKVYVCPDCENQTSAKADAKCPVCQKPMVEKGKEAVTPTPTPTPTPPPPTQPEAPLTQPED